MKKILFSAVSALALASFAADSTQFGAMQVLSGAQRTLVAIPWDNTVAGGGDIAVSNLVLTANLTVGDTLDTLATNGATLARWRLDTVDGVKYWQSIHLVGTNWEAYTPDADKATVKRGSSVILIRQAFTNDTGAAIPFFVMGQVANSVPTVTIVAGTSANPCYNMIAPPSTVAQSLNGGDHGATWKNVNSLDRIYVSNDNGFPTELMYEEGVWKFGDKVKFGRLYKTVWNEYTNSIPVGTGFWYVSFGGSPAVTWKDVPKTTK